MDAWFDIRRLVRQTLPPLLCVLVIAYFGYHAVQGERGVLAHARLAAELAEIEVVAARVKAARERLERRVALMHPDHIDPDMLDEQVRDVLGLAHPDDLIIYLDQRSSSED